MPDHRFEAPTDEPLFPADDPLTITVPGADGKPQKYLCLDRANPPLESDVDPERRPISYLVELLRLQVVEEEREAFEEALVLAIQENRIMVGQLIEVARWLGEQRQAAEKGELARVVKRPTKARPRSTR